MTNWSDTPPTVAGTYWVKSGNSEDIVTLDGDQGLWIGGHPISVLDLTGFQFGRRIPTNAELGELPGLIDGYADKLVEGAEHRAYRDVLCEQADAIFARINAILWVAE